VTDPNFFSATTQVKGRFDLVTLPSVDESCFEENLQLGDDSCVFVLLFADDNRCFEEKKLRLDDVAI
jgi:hypothetical protein